MNAAQFKQRVTIQQKQITGTGDRGQPVYSWVNLATDVPAMVEPLTGRKLEIARQLVPTASHRVTMRYLTGLGPQCQVVFGNRTFSIGAVQDRDELRFCHYLTVTEVQNTGITAALSAVGSGGIEVR